MKISSAFYVFVLLTMLLAFSIPVVTLAQKTFLAEVVADAERDAEKYADSRHWFMRGFFCFLPGASVEESISLPPARLLGKSPEYIRLYAATYGKKVKKIRTTSVTMGYWLSYISCCAGVCAGMGIAMSFDEF